MKKSINILFFTLMLAVFSACINDNEPIMAKAVLSSTENLSFESTDAESLIITISVSYTHLTLPTNSRV